MRILIPVDGSAPSRGALRFAAERARRMASPAELTVINVEPAVPAGNAICAVELQAVRQLYADSAAAVLDGMLAEAGDLPVRRSVAYGRAGEVIASTAVADGADLIVMGTRGRSGMRQLLLGSTSRSVLAHSRHPLLLVQEPFENMPDDLHVTLAADGSPYGAAAARFIAERAAFFGRRPTVDVLCVLPDMERWLKNTSRGVVPIVEKARERWAEEADELWQRSVARPLEILARAGIEARGVRRVGLPAEEIAAHVAETGGIVAMGSHGAGRLLQAVLGSTATKICAAVKVPVLIVRADPAELRE